MDFKDYSIDISYRNIGEEAFCDIINPLLSCSKLYRRSVAFFNSNALKFINDGIVNLAKNGGKIQLATSPKLSQEDIDAIKMGYDARTVMENRLLDEIELSLNEIDDIYAKKLYQLIKEDIMDIKIVLKDNGLYHDKLAVLTDVNDNVVVFVGSNNESEGGYDTNYEKIRVYRSWKENDRVLDEIDEFESIWNKSNDLLTVYDFTKAYKEKLLEAIEQHIKYKSERKKPFELRKYQEEAIDAWVNNGYKGFFEMATGTGKTVTALYSIMKLIKDNPVFTVILAPYKHLVNQWVDTINEHFKNQVDVVIVHSEIKNPEQLIYAHYLNSKKVYRPLIVVSTIKSFFIDRYQYLYNKIEYDKLLVVDEAHNFINQLSDELYDSYIYKLGLSATPVFGRDVDKTNLLLNWFGGRVISLPIEKAIGKHLVNYYYYPIYVNATESDEDSFRKATQVMLSCVDQKTGKIIDEEKFNVAYRNRLRSISMAEEKIERINEIYERVKEKDHTIIYCSDGKLFRSMNGADSEEIKHLQFVLKLINNNISNINIREGLSLKASRFTATEDAKTRMNLIESFNKGRINYLVAIKCLDEGVDIPSIKSALILSSNDNYREFVQRRGRILRKYDDKKFASIYDVIVLPSHDNKQFAEIEFRRYLEYAKLAINKDDLLEKLNDLIEEYELSLDDIQFKNEYIYGGDLDE